MKSKGDKKTTKTPARRRKKISSHDIEVELKGDPNFKAIVEFKGDDEASRKAKVGEVVEDWQRLTKDGDPAKLVKLVKYYTKKHDYNIELGKRIALLRLYLGYKRQADFAAAFPNLTRAAVGNWERGAGVSRRSLLMICQTFNASIEWLQNDIGEMIVGMNEKQHQKSDRARKKRMALLKADEHDAFQKDVDRVFDALLEERLKRAGRAAPDRQ